MTRRIVSFLLLPGILLGLFLRSDGVPVTYDQRQDGKTNVHGKLDNFLFVLAVNDFLNHLATQALEINLSPLSSKEETEESPQSTVYEVEEGNHDREPYHVEIVRIEKEAEDGSKTTVNSSMKPEVEDLEKKISKQPSKDAEDSKENVEKEKAVSASADDKAGDKKGRTLWKYTDSRKLLEKENEHVVLIHVRKSGELKSSDSYQQDFSVKEEISKAPKPGISLKKQLPREYENAFPVRQEKNDVEHLEIKPQELKLLGGGIENCGPGRYRDRSGICQFDENFN